MELSVILSGLGVIALCIVIPVHLLSRKYDRLMGSDHISELSLKFKGLKSKAVDTLEDEISENEIAKNSIQTSTGFAVLYTISKEENGSHTHHLSISQNGSLIAHTAAMVMAAWFAKILSVDPSKMVVPLDVGDSGGTIRHIIFVLDGEEQSKFIEQEVVELSVKQVQEIYSDFDKLREPIVNNSLNRQN